MPPWFLACVKTSWSELSLDWPWDAFPWLDFESKDLLLRASQLDRRVSWDLVVPGSPPGQLHRPQTTCKDGPLWQSCRMDNSLPSADRPSVHFLRNRTHLLLLLSDNIHFFIESHQLFLGFLLTFYFLRVTYVWLGGAKQIVTPLQSVLWFHVLCILWFFLCVCVYVFLTPVSRIYLGKPSFYHAVLWTGRGLSGLLFVHSSDSFDICNLPGDMQTLQERSP